MLRKLRVVLPLVLLALLLCCAALADDLSDFKFSVTGDTVTVTGYTGSASSVKIPDWYQGKRVTALGPGLFKNNKTVTSVSLPSTVTVLGEGAFESSSIKSLSYYTASSTPPADQKPTRTPGDANEDGYADLFDALLVLQYDAGWDVSINVSNSDVNADGFADLFDALLILQYDAGWDVTLQ